jgi:DNA polymerase III delta prime subunit
MTQFVHIVQAHPVELGKPNLAKVVEEREFDTVNQAQEWIKCYNHNARMMKVEQLAVYLGCVNDETGELV